MILEQYYLDCLSQASYLIADEASGEAAVIDPRRDVAVYLDAARDQGLEIRHVLLTHFHADFVSGHLELAEATGARIHLGAAAETEYASHGMADGDSLRLGEGLRVVALATPGHTPESTCYLLYDLAASEVVPHAVFTGDTLFVGDVGRPDLLASVGVTADELATQLYDSLHGKLLALPDETVVYPGHGAGSACGKNLGSETSTTLGQQRKLNYALQPMEKTEFVALVTAGQPTAPAYFPHDARLNRQDHDTFGDVLARALTPLGPSALARLEDEDDVQVLDVRAPDSYAASHRKGSLSVGLDGRFAGWAGAVLDLERPVVVIADAGREEEAITRLARVGVDRVVGYLDGGTFALQERLASFPRLAPRQLAERLEGEDAPLVLDVRGPGEREGSRIEPSLHIPLPELPGRLDEVPRDKPLVVHCAGGYRSAIATSLLLRHGLDQVADLRGGMKAWQAAGLPVAGDGAASCSASGPSDGAACDASPDA